MLRLAKAAAETLSSRPTLLGVNGAHLAGQGRFGPRWFLGSTEELVVSRVHLCREAGIGGVVASALEVGAPAKT
jgi:hypothetical protein